MLDPIVFSTFILPYIIGISPDFFAAKNQRNTPLADSPFSPSNFQSMSCPLCKVIFQRWSPQSVPHILVIRSLVIISRHARVAKLVDAPDLGSGGSSMGVRVPSRAPDRNKEAAVQKEFLSAAAFLNIKQVI